jgi:tetratricopeptide (TPR) repeat protein
MDLAHLWESRLLDKPRAIAHFQQAFKADPTNREALENARRIYWEVGRFETVAKLLSLELKLATDEAEKALLYKELAEVSLLVDNFEKAQAACKECLKRQADDMWCREILDDLSEPENAEKRAAELERDSIEGRQGVDSAFRAAILLRISEADPIRIENFLIQAILLNYEHRGIVCILEGAFAQNGRFEELVELHERIILSAPEPQRANVLYGVGLRWLFRHTEPERAVSFLERAVRLEPNLPGLGGCLHQLYVENGQYEAAADLLAFLLEKVEGDNRLDVLELAGELWSKNLSNPERAAVYFKELRRFEPENVLAGQFFEENEMTTDAGSDSNREDLQETTEGAEAAMALSTPPEGEQSSEDGLGSQSGEPDSLFDLMLDRSIPPDLEEAMESARAEEAQNLDQGIAAWQKAWALSPGHPDIVDKLLSLFEQSGKWPALADFFKKQSKAVSDEDKQINILMALAQIYDEHLKQDVMVVNTYQSIVKIRDNYLPAIDAAINKYEAMNRWPDLVKMLKAKGEVVVSKEEKVNVWLTVAKLFIDRFSNQAEAIKAFENVLEAEPYHEEAINYLKEMYEKRRDWEKLIAVMAKEAEHIDDPAEKIDRYVNMADLATERLKRPNICVERWEAVLEFDPDNEKALDQLAGLYERTKEWDKLGAILENQAKSVLDDKTRAEIFQKLGQVYGEKLGDDAKAIDAWKALLELIPEDRRAQEQLKKRYLAQQAWDELEQFYEASGKWDEFIRVLEREADKPDLEVEAKISMQFKIAELWKDKKSRIDRAARCYETILSHDSDNLEAAEAYIPILEEGKDMVKLADVLEVRLRHLADDVEKLELRQRIAAAPR